MWNDSWANQLVAVLLTAIVTDTDSISNSAPLFLSQSSKDMNVSFIKHSQFPFIRSMGRPWDLTWKDF